MAAEQSFDPPGLSSSVGEMSSRLVEILAGVEGLTNIEAKVETDVGNLEAYIKESAKISRRLFHIIGKTIEQEPLRFMNMFAASSVSGMGGAQRKFAKPIMEYKAIQNLRAVNGDKSMFRQWRQKFTTALGQVVESHEEIVHRLVKEIDLSREMEKIVTGLRTEYGEEFERASGDVWNILIDKAEMEAYDKIKMVPKGEGVIAYGIMYRWFTDVSGLGLAEQARKLMHPDPPKREEELAECVEMWQDKMRRLEAHGDEYKLAPVFKINALRMLMTGKAKEYFDLWEADRDPTDAAKTYNELLGKVTD